MSDPTVNQKIAMELGYRVEIMSDNSGASEYLMFAPDGTKLHHYLRDYWTENAWRAMEKIIWEKAPDFLRDLNATSQVLAEYDVTLRLDYGPASAARIIPEGRINEPPLPEFVTHSAVFLRAEMSELAARSLLAYLEWKSQEGS